jgi:hypothetical protein
MPAPTRAADPTIQDQSPYQNTDARLATKTPASGRNLKCRYQVCGGNADAPSRTKADAEPTTRVPMPSWRLKCRHVAKQLQDRRRNNRHQATDGEPGHPVTGQNGDAAPETLKRWHHVDKTGCRKWTNGQKYPCQGNDRNTDALPPIKKPAPSRLPQNRYQIGNRNAARYHVKQPMLRRKQSRRRHVDDQKGRSAVHWPRAGATSMPESRRRVDTKSRHPVATPEKGARPAT